MKELENSHRKYLGLKEIDPHWIRIEICNEVIYHNGTSVLKEIRSEKGGYFECDLNEPLPEKLNKTTIGKLKSGSVYFSYYSPHIMRKQTSCYCYFLLFFVWPTCKKR